MPPRRLRTLALAALALAAAPAAAQEPVRIVAFAWARGDGADRCPAQSEVMAAVRQRLGRDPFSATAPATAEAAVERAADRWRARLIFRDPQGAVRMRRDLEDASADCATIASAVAVSVSLALDASSGPAPAPVPDAERPPPVQLTAPPPPPPPERAWAVLQGEMVWGPLPGVALGFAPGFGGRLVVPVHRRWSVWGSMMFNPQTRVGDAQGWAFGMTRVAAGACFRAWRRGGFELDACLGLSFGLMQAVTFGFDPVEPGDYPWFAIPADVRAVWRPSARWPLRVDLGVSPAGSFVTAFEGTFRTGPSPRTVFAPEFFTLSVSLGLGAEF